MNQQYNYINQQTQRYQHQYFVHIPRSVHCHGSWWRKRCHWFDVKPNPLPFYNRHPYYVTVLENEQNVQEEDNSLTNKSNIEEDDSTEDFTLSSEDLD